MTLSSRRPDIAICSVRGIGVAVRVRTWTSARSVLSRSLWVTPKCCSSSTMTRPSFLNSTLFGEERVSADDDVDLARPDPLLGRPRFGGGDQAREPADLDRKALEALAERAEMLAGEEGGRRDQCDLMPRHRRSESGAQRHFGLAETDIAADQPVHRLARPQIGHDLGDRAVLIVGLLIGKTIRECGVAGVGLDQCAGAQRAFGGDFDEVARDGADPLLHPRLAPLPRLAAEPVERHALALRAVAREDVDILDRDVELVAARISQRDAIVRRLLDRNLGQPLVAADAVIGVDDEVARRQRRELGEEGVGALAALAPAHQPVAEHVLLGKHSDVGAGEAVIERDDRERGRRRGQRLTPALDLDRLAQAVLGEQAAEALARARRIAGEARPSCP